MVVAVDLCHAVNFDIQKRTLPLLIDNDVVNLIDGIPIGGSPTQFVNIFVEEDCSTNYAPVAKTEFSKPLSIIVDSSEAVLPHCILLPGLIIPNISI